MQTPAHRTKATTAGMLLGIGLGGFVDGITLHQILQWHNMLSNWLPPTTMDAMQRNMVWDGLFHALVWLVTLLGVFLLWSAAYQQETMPSLGAFIGQLLFGWGLFNLVEGIIDHHILSIHHVVEMFGLSTYDYLFLGSAVLFVLIGSGLIRAGARDQLSTHPAPYTEQGPLSSSGSADRLR